MVHLSFFAIYISGGRTPGLLNKKDLERPEYPTSKNTKISLALRIGVQVL